MMFGTTGSTETQSNERACWSRVFQMPQQTEQEREGGVARGHRTRSVRTFIYRKRERSGDAARHRRTPVWSYLPIDVPVLSRTACLEGTFRREADSKQEASSADPPRAPLGTRCGEDRTTGPEWAVMSCVWVCVYVLAHVCVRQRPMACVLWQEQSRSSPTPPPRGCRAGSQ